MTMTIGSLFSGIGGLELGLERAGLGPVIWQAETDRFCRRVLAKHWPSARRYDNVRSIDAETERPDIICGGFPCQDVSNAGKRAGLAGQRSGLWREYARIVRELRPRVVVVENVAALLGRGFGDVLGDLAACGYDAEWDCIPAAAIGAPHRRDRVFVVAWRVSDPERDGLRDQPERGEGGSQAAHSRDAEPRHLGENMADADGEAGGREARVPHDRDGGIAARGRAPEPGRRSGNDWPPAPNDVHAWRRVQADSQPAICRVATRIPERTHRLRTLGNAVVPHVAEVVGRHVVGALERSALDQRERLE